MRLIPPRRGLPRQTHESSSPAKARRLDPAGPPESQSHDGLPLGPAQPRPGSEALSVGLSLLRCFSQVFAETTQQEAEERREKGDTPENGPTEPVLSDSGTPADTDLLSDCEPDPQGHTIGRSKPTVASGLSLPESHRGHVLFPILAPSNLQGRGGLQMTRHPERRLGANHPKPR